jgi:hypothetical protein
MAQYDVPGMLDYILSVTNHSKMAYVGHSQVAALCLCAEHVYDPRADGASLVSMSGHDSNVCGVGRRSHAAAELVHWPWPRRYSEYV